jgi:ankyrin repeat protein
MTEDLYLHSNADIRDGFMEKLKEALVLLYCKVLEFQARALCFLQKNTLSRMTKNMFNEKWDVLIESITSQETEVQKFTRLLDAKGTKDTKMISQDIRKSLERNRLQQTSTDRDSKVSQFIKMLYTCPYRDRKDRVDNRIPGTCEWFTNHPHFQNWNHDNTSSLLWVSADPGCGKSVLAKYLVDEVLPSTGKRKICYFFFRDDYPDQRRSTIALASMLRQLYLAEPSLLSDSVLAQYDKEGEAIAKSFRTLWDILKSITTSSDFGEIICVVDALDECQEDERKQLVEAITDLYPRGNNNHNLKFLLTSRPYQRIREEFRVLEDQMPTIHLSGEGEAEVREISREIDLVIAKRVHSISLRKQLEQHEQDFLREKLTEMPHRTYLWAALTLDYIQALDGFTKGKIRETVHSIPDTVDDAYDKILSKSKDQSKAKRLLHIVLAAEKPLSVEELSLAMAIEREGQPHDDILESTEPAKRFKSTLRNICGLILVVVDNRVYLLHQTVKEFLVRKSSDADDSESSSNWARAFPVAESNKFLAEICVWYLDTLSKWDLDAALIRFLDSPPKEFNYARTQHLDAASKLSSLYVLLHYSIVCWAHHFREACFRSQDRMTILASHLCTPTSKFYKIWVMSYQHKEHELEFLYQTPPVISEPLVISASRGLYAVVQKLLEEDSMEVDIRDSVHDNTALTWAAARGHDSIVSLLLDTGKVNLESKDSLGRTPLSLAAEYGHDAVVRLLLNTGKVNLDSEDSKYGRTPLTWAAGYGQDAVVTLLLSTGKVNLSSRDSRGQTALLWAAREGHDAVVRLLLNTGKVDIESKDSKYGRTPLSWAAEYGYDAVVRLLLNTGKVDIESQDPKFGRTPLLWAARSGHDAVVRLLLNTGKVDIESKDSKGHTPLSWAARSGHDAVVRLLLNTGKVDIESEDSEYGQTPLSWAARSGHDAVVTLLLSTGKVDVESEDSKGQTPLSWAAGCGHDAVVTLLLNTGKVDTESRDSGGRTPLSWAAGYDAVVRLLLNTGKVDIESRDSEGRTPLSWAAGYGQDAVVRLLLNTGKVDIESEDSEGRTPLSWAAKHGYDAVVTLLMDAKKMGA